MAIRAIMQKFDSASSDDNALSLTVSYFLISNGDVFQGGTTAIIPNGTSLAQARVLIATAIRAQALADRGLTIPASNVFVMDFTAE